MSAQPFEGPEKKVELVVVDDYGSLRALGHDYWRAVVETAGATILSRRSNAHCDAYLLSESSLFVYDSFVTMITCGQTLLVDAVGKMVETITPEAVAVLIYERKNEHFPELQPTSFSEDAQRLSEWLPGAALRFGEEHDHAIRFFHSSRPFTPDGDDTTIEVLMHGIDERCAELFVGMEAPASGTLAEALGLSRVFEGFEIDEHVFDPVGYSLNALRDDRYFTFHVTPQRVGSYVSFETNVDFRADPSGLVSRALECFRPDSFDVVAFTAAGDSPQFEIPGYRRRRDVRAPVSGYAVVFQHFYRPSVAHTAADSIDLR